MVNSIPVSSDESYNDERGDGDVSQDIPMGARATDSPKIFVLVDEEGSEVAEASEFPDSRNPRAKRATWRQCSLRARPHRAGKPKNFKPYEQYDEFCESHHEAFGEPPRKRRAPSVRKKAESSNLVLQSVDIVSNQACTVLCTSADRDRRPYSTLSVDGWKRIRSSTTRNSLNKSRDIKRS